MPSALERLKARAKMLRTQTHALYLAQRDPRCPWYARAVAIATVAYAVSPIDLIPDPIPIIGYLDDLLIVPVGFWLALRLVPADVMSDARHAAESASDDDMGAAGRAAAGVVIGVWVAAAALIAWTVWRVARR
jgi:uncharacterized membrane protein YkvA (DUF1232 family)